MKPKKDGTFNAQAFLDSAGIAKKVVEYRRSEVIFTQGDPCEHVMYIRKGDVKLSVLSKTGKEAVVAMLGPGDFFGEGLPGGQPVRMGTATVVADSTILLVDKEEMVRSCTGNTRCQIVHRAHAGAEYPDRRGPRRSALQLQREATGPDAVAAGTLRQARQAGPGRPPVSQETLAEMVGTTRSRVNFFMKKFQRLGSSTTRTGSRSTTRCSPSSSTSSHSSVCVRFGRSASPRPDRGGGPGTCVLPDSWPRHTHHARMTPRPSRSPPCSLLYIRPRVIGRIVSG